MLKDTIIFTFNDNKKGVWKTDKPHPSKTETDNQKFKLAPTSNPIFLSLKIYTGPAVRL